LKREFGLVSELNHENIIKYLCLRPPDILKKFGIIMEYMAGGSLQQQIEDNFDNMTVADKIKYAK